LEIAIALIDSFDQMGAMKFLPTLRQLRFLVALADRRHFGQAAEACLVSQSTLSAAIRELEDGLGVILFDRTRRSVAPTGIGVEVAERARTLLRQAEDLVDIAIASHDPLSGPLRLGVIPTIGPFLLPRALAALRAAAPDLKLYLREEQTAPLVDRLEAGQLDAAVLALPAAIDDAESEEIAIDPFYVVCPPGHRLAGLATVQPADMASEDLLLLEDGHCLREHALAACHFEGARRNAAFQGTSLHTLVQMAASGLGVTLVPEMAIASGITAGLDLHVAPLGGDRPWRRIALVWRRTSGRKETFRELAALMRAALTIGRERPAGRRRAELAPAG
jgi:LysR family transcriptional regulator, hydrogen peroxide-inducible genes activator